MMKDYWIEVVWFTGDRESLKFSKLKEYMLDALMEGSATPFTPWLKFIYDITKKTNPSYIDLINFKYY